MLKQLFALLKCFNSMQFESFLSTESSIHNKVFRYFMALTYF